MKRKDERGNYGSTLEGGSGGKLHPIKLASYGRGLVLPRYLQELRRGE